MPLLRPATAIALASVAFLPACLAGPDAPRTEPEPTAEPEGAVGAALAALAAGDVALARASLEELYRGDRLAEARARLVAGEPAEALVAIDEALELDPGRQEVLLLKADASLRLAELHIAQGGGGAGLIEGALADASDYYARSGKSAHALFGAARAAFLAGRVEEALALVEAGHVAAGSVEPELGALPLGPERIEAEAALVLHARALAAEDPALETLAASAEDALMRHLGRAPDELWTWSELARLQETSGRLADARRSLELALLRRPEEPALLANLARVTARLAGPADAVSALESFVARHPKVPAGRWHLAVARFDAALAGLQGEPRGLAREPFTRVEQEFRALREQFPEFESGAYGYEVVCRLARGWCAFHAGELDQAEQEFLAMEELFPRAIEWSYPGTLESGIQGLFFVADAHVNAERWEAAGTTFERLSALQPEVAQWANNAGVNLRDAADPLAKEAADLCDAARGRESNADLLAELRALAGTQAPAGGSEERSAFRRAADERAAKATALMERSFAAYARAAELTPTDVRIVNDAALVLVWYLHRDLARAEAWLLQCVELGATQLEERRRALANEADPARAEVLEGEFDQLQEAWGDAHQNLAVLAWVHHRDAAATAHWAERALTLDPDRPGRIPVRNSLLPLARGEASPEEDDPWALLSWGRPCPEP